MKQIKLKQKLVLLGVGGRKKNGRELHHGQLVVSLFRLGRNVDELLIRVCCGLSGMGGT
jgi:hypothetical protein